MLFPQTLAYARQILSRGERSRAAMGINTLRTVFSLAWVVGPPLAAVLLDAHGFTLLYGTAAAMYALAALVAVAGLDSAAAGPAAPAASPVAGRDPAPPEPLEPPAPPEATRWTLLLTAAAFTMLQCPLTLGVQALPLFIRADLGGRPTDAGAIFGLCAALEIPLMLGLGALAIRIRVRVLVIAGAGCGVAYYGLATVAPDVWVLAAGQVVDAAFISAVAGLGISYTQDLLPRRPGQATTLFTNSYPVGAMLAGPLFGLAERFGFRLAYGASTILCGAGLLVLLATRPPAGTGAPAGGGDTTPARAGVPGFRGTAGDPGRAANG